MQRNEDYLELESCIEDINYEIAVLSKDLLKATEQVASSRRARMTTFRLAMLFKKFRKGSCLLGLK